MAQLVKHSIKQNCVLWLQHLAAISPPSPSAGNLIDESSERSWSFWHAWLPCKHLSCEASVEKFQETENSVEVKLEGNKSSNHSEVQGEVVKGSTIRENAGRPYKKFPSRATSSLRRSKDKDAVPEEQGPIETSTGAPPSDVETSTSGESPMKEGNSGKHKVNFKYAPVRCLEREWLKQEMVAVAETGNGFNPKGYSNVSSSDSSNVPDIASAMGQIKKEWDCILSKHSSSDSSNVPDIASAMGQIKKEWDRILSKHSDWENSQNVSESAAPESQLPSVQLKVQANHKLPSESEKAALTPDPGYTICVEQPSLNFDVSLITELLSLYGDIEGSFRRMRVDGIWNTFVKFKTEEAKENALAAGWLYIGGKQLAIGRVDQVMTTVVRISNASPAVTDNGVLYKCEAWGRVDNIKRRGKGIFDVYFKVKELPNMTSILNSLNNITLNHRRWKALPAPLVHRQAVEDLFKKKGGASWYHSQQLGVIVRMEAAIDNLMVDLQDLRELCDLGG